MENIKKLYRSRTNKIFGGVIGGLGNFWNTDPLAIRLGGFVFSLVFWCFVPVFIITYLVMWMFVKKEPKEVTPVNNEVV